MDNITISKEIKELYNARFNKRLNVEYRRNQYIVCYSGSGKLIAVDCKSGNMRDGICFLKNLPLSQETWEKVKKELIL